MRFVQAKNYSRANRSAIDLVVIHTAECGETAKADENVAGYFAGAHAPMASAHYTVDADSITQSVLEKDIAWHAGPVNGYSIGIEHAGYAKQSPAEWADAYSLAMLERSAELVGDICKRYGIPVRRLTAEDLARGERHGICGHVDVTKGLKAGTHWDPGPNFPWNAYLDRVAEYAGGRGDVRDRVPAPSPEPERHVELLPGEGDFVEVECNGVIWLVAPHHIGPIGIGEAEDLARANGCELPSPELVEAIHKAADLKLTPIPRAHDGSLAGMAKAYAGQKERIAAQIAGRPYRLLDGDYKTVAIKDGKVGIVGWYYPDGRKIQPFFAGHSKAWGGPTQRGDGSQGCRLVRRKS